jgi:hypothetical protein
MDEIETLAPAPETSAQPEPSSEPSKNLGDALDNAFDSVFADEPEMQSGRSRDERGRFAPKEAAPVEAKAEPEVRPEPVKAEVAEKPEQADKPFNPDEPPSRLSKEAQAAWKAAPPAIKADVHRAFQEMEQGIVKYREQATRWNNEIEPYQQLAQQYGMDVKGVLADYEGMSRMMATDPVRVFDTLAQRHGFTLQEVAAHVLQQDLDEYAQQTASQIKQLQAENAELKRMTQTYTQTQQAQVQNYIAEFAVKNPRYDELEPKIAAILRSGLVTAQEPRAKLQEAYDIANRLNPAPQMTAPQTPDRMAQTQKGQLSVTGAPGTGSNPAFRKPPANARSAVDNAFDKLGL